MASPSKALRLPIKPCYQIRTFSRLLSLSTRAQVTSTSISNPRNSPRLRPRQATQPTHQRKPYYTATQTLPPPYTPIETAILSASLTHVPEHGFTTTALLHGIADTGYLPATTNLFPRGPVDLIFYHMRTARANLSTAFPEPSSDAPPSAATITERTVALLLHRLHANAPFNAHIPAAMAQLAQPTYVPAAVTDLATLADEIVYLSGTTALDTSWYTRRAAIGAVYAASELFMTQDTSQGFQETEGFVRRRVDGINRAAWVRHSVSEWVGFTAASMVNLLRNWGMRI